MTEKKEKPTLEQIENTVEMTTNSLRTAMTPIGQLPDWRKQMNYEQVITEAIQDLQGALHDLELRRPMVVATEDLPHVCDDCQVTLNNLDPEEHCVGCNNEMELASYVPKELRYADPTEVSLELDEPE